MGHLRPRNNISGQELLSEAKYLRHGEIVLAWSEYLWPSILSPAKKYFPVPEIIFSLGLRYYLWAGDNYVWPIDSNFFVPHGPLPATVHT